MQTAPRGTIESRVTEYRQSGAVGAKFGRVPWLEPSTQSIVNRVAQAEINTAVRQVLTTDEKAELKRLRSEIRVLRSSIRRRSSISSAFVYGPPISQRVLHYVSAARQHFKEPQNVPKL